MHPFYPSLGRESEDTILRNKGEKEVGEEIEPDDQTTPK